MKNVLKSLVAVAFAFSLAMPAFGADGKGKIEGKVVGKDGAAAAGVMVRVAPVKAKGDKKDKAAPTAAADDKKDKAKDAGVLKGKTEADGTFKFADVPAGDYIATAMSKKDNLNARQKISVKADETAKVELKLAEAKGGKKKEAK